MKDRCKRCGYGMYEVKTRAVCGRRCGFTHKIIHNRVPVEHSRDGKMKKI